MASVPTLVTCLNCGHASTLERADTPLSRLTRRLVCSVCGSRAVKAKDVTGDAPGRHAVGHRRSRPT